LEKGGGGGGEEEERLRIFLRGERKKKRGAEDVPIHVTKGERTMRGKEGSSGGKFYTFFSLKRGEEEKGMGFQVFA